VHERQFPTFRTEAIAPGAMVDVEALEDVHGETGAAFYRHPVMNDVRA
jgi:hypothetical protein